MPLPYKQLRLVHLVLAPLTGLFVYAPSLRADPLFLAVMQFGVFPLIALAGLTLWLGPKLARRRRKSARESAS